MNILGLIPARGGSKAIPHKNLAALAGRPLITYTFEAAQASHRLNHILLSTDDEAIAAHGRLAGIEVPFLRPAELAADETPMLPVVLHAVRWLAENRGYEAEVVVLLQPTSPLRRGEHVDAAVDLLFSSEADTVVSVVPVPHQFNPVSLMHLRADGTLMPYLDGPMILRRQDKPLAYARNGPAVLVTRREVIEGGSLYGGAIRPLEMAAADSVDIDQPLDLIVAECLLSHQKKLATSGTL